MRLVRVLKSLDECFALVGPDTKYHLYIRG
jgi:hypothetical protein